MLPGWCCIANRHIGARERRQLIPHVHFQVPFLGSESQLKSGFACVGLFCISDGFQTPPHRYSVKGFDKADQEQAWTGVLVAQLVGRRS